VNNFQAPEIQAVLSSSFCDGNDIAGGNNSRHSSPKLKFWKFQLFICSKDRVMIADLRNI